MKKLIILISLVCLVFTAKANAFLTTYYFDADGDGYGNPAISIEDSSPPPGYVTNSDDCNDGDYWISPGQYEFCDGIDNDCDGLVDDDDPLVYGPYWLLDSDNDGYGNNFIYVVSCSQPDGYVGLGYNIDCDDTNPDVNPRVSEIICNGIDDNCDGLVDPELCNGMDDDCDGETDEGVNLWYLDFDGDGFYGNYISIQTCTAPLGWSNNPMLWDGCDIDPYSTYDCTGYNNEGFGTEACNGWDDDGNGLIDEDDPGLMQIPWYQDADNDGYGNPDISVIACSQPEGYVPWPNNLDCDDSNPGVHPGAQEFCNGIDDDCDGIPDPENCNGMDTDCDGIPDDIDICPDGDDSVDNNDDGIADCSQLLNYNDYNPDWYCGANKIYVCHNDNNPQTICIDGSALPAHYDHGDQIGPCTSCPQNSIIPGNTNPAEDAFQSMVTSQMDSAYDAGEYPFNNHVLTTYGDSMFFVLPNPADDYIEVRTAYIKGVISVMDVSGKVVFNKVLSAQKTRLDTDSLSDGIYLIRLENGEHCHTKSLIVIH